jgi:hydroxymethylglutaryl-CoA synthase
MRVGIEKIEGYTSRLSLELEDLAVARRMDRSYPQERLMAARRSVLPPFEDAVTLAVNAARRLLQGVDTSSIGLLVVATESGVDFGKPVSTWVHRFCELPARCRNFEVKHACYGGTAALNVAASWVASRQSPGKKALVISADHSRNHVGSRIEFISGGGAIAMLVSDEPAVLALDLGQSGLWSYEIADTFRPSPTAEEGNSQESLYSYLDALEESFAAYEAIHGDLDPRNHFRRQIYHTPFPGMALQAHRALLGRYELSKSEVHEDFEARVAPTLWISQEVGGTYSASVFVNLLALLNWDRGLREGDRLGVFSYGSGCQAEFFSGTLGPAAVSQVRSLDWEGHLSSRSPLSVETYEALEAARESLIHERTAPALTPVGQSVFEPAYEGRGLLILDRLEDYRRHYRWS